MDNKHNFKAIHTFKKIFILSPYLEYILHYYIFILKESIKKELIYSLINKY